MKCFPQVWPTVYKTCKGWFVRCISGLLNISDKVRSSRHVQWRFPNVFRRYRRSRTRSSQAQSLPNALAVTSYSDIARRRVTKLNKIGYKQLLYALRG